MVVSDFWMVDANRKSLFTYLVRLAVNRNRNESFDDILNYFIYDSKIRYSVKRFIDGNVYTKNFICDGSRGWCHHFAHKQQHVIDKMLTKTPTPDISWWRRLLSSWRW